MKLFIFALLFIAAQAKSQYEVKDKISNVTCVLLDINGTIILEADHAKENKTKVTTNFDKAVLIDSSNCSVIKLNLDNKTQVWFQLSADKNVVPIVSFDSSLVFNVSKDVVTVQGDELKVAANHSYLCNSEVGYKFNTTELNNYTYTISPVLHNFQIQFNNIVNDTFGPSDSCEQDKTSTASPSTATTPTTAAPTTTAAPPNEDLFVCKEGSITRFRFEANISLAITYETSKENVTAYISVPLHTSNDSSCSNQTEEVLNIRFLEHFNLTYVFQRKDNTSESFYVSQITLSYDTVYFKDAKKNGTLTAEYISKDTNYLSASKTEYYRCNANITTPLGTNVVLSTVELKYRAFNEKGDIEFKGEATECSADEETSSVVPIAVGAALAGLVVIVLIAYLIGRRRSRKAGYESV